MPAAAQLHDEEERRSRQLPPDCVELAHTFPITVSEAHAEGASRVPNRIHLSPAGELDEQGRRIVRGRDGRRFEVPSDPSVVISGTELPMMLDRDHESLFWFGTTAARGWVKKITYSDGKGEAAGFWGDIEEWTPEGRDDVETRRYRGISPAVRYQFREPEKEGDEEPPPLLIGFVNAALTNRPNLRMTLLNSEQQRPARAPAKEHSMHESEKALRARLGLPETATHAEVALAAMAAFGELVPRADLHAALTRATEAEGKLAKVAQTAHAAAVKSTLDEARKAGKIAPASIPHYEKMCATPEGLASARELFATLPSIVAPDHRSDDDPPGTPGGKTKLDPFQAKMARDAGLTEDEYLAAMREADAIERGSEVGR